MPQITPELYFFQLVLTFISAIVASSGFWMYLDKKRGMKERKDPKNRLLMGLAHDRILYLGISYIKRGSITQDEYENVHCLYDPYREMEGNGSASRIMCEVEKLPIKEGKFSNRESECNEITR